MHIRSRLAISLLVGFSLLKPVTAQDHAASKDSPDTVTAFASGDHVRFTAPSSIVQIRLEVYNLAGRKLFDNEVRGGNVLDWQLRDGQAEPLADDTYLCVVTVKNVSGKLTERIGSVTIMKPSATIRAVDASQMTAQQSQAIGPIEENASLTVLNDDSSQTATVIAHNGEEGQITRGRGALSFRIGDFFRGSDAEQMRLTQEGNLGIGITNPRARLDVDGLIRTSQGILFPDGTIQTTASGTAGTSRPTTPTLGGADQLGSLNQNPNGKKGKRNDHLSPELFVNEDLTVNGNIIFTPPPLSLPARDITIQNNTGGLRFYGAPFPLTTTPAAAAIQFWGNNSVFPGQLYLDSGAHNDGAVIMRTTGAGGTITERMRVTSSGNVGIGTASPLARLQLTTVNDTNPGFITAWDARHFVIGGGGNSGGIGMSYDQTNQVGYIESLTPNVAWRNLVLQSGGGRVGIGTSAPAARLAVQGDGIAVLIGSAGCPAPTGAIGFGAMGGCNDFALGGDVSNNANAGVFINRPTGRSLHFRENNGADQMTIVPGGNVGIGTSSPYPFASLHATSRSVGVLGESNDIINGLGGWFKNTGNTAAIAIRADGNAVQTLDSGGWVKAMAYVDPANGIVRCYNSQASGLVRTVPPCGFNFTYGALGSHIIDFGFDIRGRFILVTAGESAVFPVTADFFCIGCSSTGFVIIHTMYVSNGDRTDAPFFVFVF